MQNDYMVGALALFTLLVVLGGIGWHLGWFLRKPENREHAKNAFKQD